MAPTLALVGRLQSQVTALAQVSTQAPALAQATAMARATVRTLALVQTTAPLSTLARALAQAPALARATALALASTTAPATALALASTTAPATALALASNMAPALALTLRRTPGLAHVCPNGRTKVRVGLNTTMAAPKRPTGRVTRGATWWAATNARLPLGRKADGGQLAWAETDIDSVLVSTWKT